MNLMAYKEVQNVAKGVHDHLVNFINPSSTEASIVEKAKELLAENNIVDTWYHDVPAFVLLGSRSCLSISGKDYQPSNEVVGETNLITVDLSPILGSIWGDCARSYYVEEGSCTFEPHRQDFQNGDLVEKELHRLMMDFVTPGTLFSELFEFGNEQIRKLGYENLDFLGNLGHSIETDVTKRRYIDQNCHEKLGSVMLFTFEPHIRKVNEDWGFKYENIYYFDRSGGVVEL